MFLGSFHYSQARIPRSIFFSEKLPARKQVGASCDDMIKRLKWFFKFQDNPMSNVRIKVRRPICDPKHNVPIEIQWCASHLKNKVLEHFDKISSCKVARPPAFVKVA